MLFPLSVEFVVWRVLAQPLKIRLTAESGRKNLCRMVFIKTRNNVSGDAEFGAKSTFMRGNCGKKNVATSVFVRVPRLLRRNPS